MVTIKTVERNLQLAKTGHAKDIPKYELIEMLEKLQIMMTDPRQGFGQTLRFYRKQAGLSRQQLGERTGISWSSLQRYEEGVRVPKNPVQARIANALGIDVKDLNPHIRHNNT